LQIKRRCDIILMNSTWLKMQLRYTIFGMAKDELFLMNDPGH